MGQPPQRSACSQTTRSSEAAPARRSRGLGSAGSDGAVIRSSSELSIAPGGVSVNRFVPGFEKTFFDRRASIEMRFPFAASISPDLMQSTAGISNSNAMVFGNMSIVYKEYIRRTDTFVASWGLQTALPTAPSLSVALQDGPQLLAVNNRSVHLMPFLGALYTPTDRFFAQGFLQLDVDANGNPVYVNPTLERLSFAGRLHDGPRRPEAQQLVHALFHETGSVVRSGGAAHRQVCDPGPAVRGLVHEIESFEQPDRVA